MSLLLTLGGQKAKKLKKTKWGVFCGTPCMLITLYGEWLQGASCGLMCCKVGSMGNCIHFSVKLSSKIKTFTPCL